MCWSLRFLRKLYLSAWADMLGFVSDSGRKEIGRSLGVGEAYYKFNFTNEFVLLLQVGYFLEFCSFL